MGTIATVDARSDIIEVVGVVDAVGDVGTVQ